MKLTPHDFLVKFMPYAIQSEGDTGISRWVTLGQCAEESGWGAKESGAFNVFGIKSFKANEPRQLVSTFEYSKNNKLTPVQIGLVNIISVVPSTSNPGYFVYSGQAWFRTFKDYAEAFDYHAAIFFKNPVYAQALTLKNDPEAFTYEIAKHYAQSPTYAQDVISIFHSLQKITL